MFTKNQMTELFEAQDALNRKYLGDDWRSKVDEPSILIAIFTETAEFFESAPRSGDKTTEGVNSWKWWKPKKENDIQNMTVETIDVLHFVLAYYLKSFPSRTYEELADAYNENIRWQFDGVFADESRNTNQRGSNMLKQFAGIIMNHYSRYMLDTRDRGEQNIAEFDSAMFMLLEQMWCECGKTSDEIYNGYFLKNKLNSDRIDGGYMEDKYEKSQDGVEDNRKLEV